MSNPLSRSAPALLAPVLVAAALLIANQAHAGGVDVEIIDGRKAKAEITLVDGANTYNAEFELEFHNPQNLTIACVGIDADVLDATEIADIESRLPDPVNQSIDPAFPVRVTVEPPIACGLEFEDDVDVEFDTPDLVYAPFSPYRLMKGPIAGAFHDITGSVTAGSVRSRGSGGSFSEFVMVKDTLQDHDADAVQAYDAIEARIDDPSISLTAQLTLQTDVALSRAAYNAGHYAQAIALLDDLDLHCGTLGGPALPNVWRSARDLVNAEGEIVTLSGNIKFALGRLDGSP
jgi:hypothetical protein